MDQIKKLERLKEKIDSPKFRAAIDKKLEYINKPVEKKQKAKKKRK